MVLLWTSPDVLGTFFLLIEDRNFTLPLIGICCRVDELGVVAVPRNG
jgi:hypothetical protein